MTQRHTTKIQLRPAAGSRFQPTGFPDLGAALFDRPDGQGGWVSALHVESPQSMANRLELTTWDTAAMTQVEACAGLPYVRVIDAHGEVLTSSRLEAHRLASAYVMDGKIGEEVGQDWFEKRLGLVAGHAIDHRRLARAVFELDPVSLLHGVFFARKKWPWQPKIARAVTCFIDADDVRAAVSGGVKTDWVNTAGGSTDTGYGMVPHQRVEYTAQRITCFLTVDHEQLGSYGLGAEATEVLEALVDYEVAAVFGAGSLRLRTACDLEVESVDGGALPDPAEAAARLTAAVGACEMGEVTDVVWTQRSKKAS